MKTKTCPELVSGLIGSKRLKKKGGLVKTRLKDKRFAKKGSSAKPTAMNTVFLDLRTSIEGCIAIIEAFEEKGYATYYDSKTKTLKTTAPKTRIKELSKLFKCIQSYSLMQRQ